MNTTMISSFWIKTEEPLPQISRSTAPKDSALKSDIKDSQFKEVPQTSNYNPFFTVPHPGYPNLSAKDQDVLKRNKLTTETIKLRSRTPVQQHL